MLWTNYFVTTLSATGDTGLVPAENLRRYIQEHNGSEAYTCAFDLNHEELKINEQGKKTTVKYDGIFRPALDHVWMDFDSHDGGTLALADARAFVSWLSIPDYIAAYSGSKGFHIGVPFQYFGLEPSKDLGARLNRLAQFLKRTYPTLDTTVFNANRKFRALGSKHPKTGLYKIWCQLDEPLDRIKERAKSRGSLAIPVPELRLPLPALVEALRLSSPLEEAKTKAKEKMDKEWTAPSGEAAFAKCGFLKFAKEQPAKVNEPQWYAALSIVSRFQDGRKQCHGISHGHPGYSAPECNAKIDQAESESAPRTCANISTLWDGCSACPYNGKINSPVNIFDTRFYIRDVDKSGKVKLIPDYNSLLKHFQSDSAFKTIADMKAVYRFKETHYEEFTPIEIKAFAEEAFEPKPQEKNRQEFYHKVLANCVERRVFFTETTANKINFTNGILDLGKRNATCSAIEQRRDAGVYQETAELSLEVHSPKIGFRGVLPYRFDPTASCPTFTWWINDVMLGDPELVKILQEFMGYVIRGGDYKYHKALWLSGSGRNGKSTFLSVLKALIGTGNYSTLSIRQIIGDKFSSADLDGKIANFSEETSPEELSDSGPFKNLTGDGELLAQKKYGDPYSFRNRAKLIMTYNEVPMLRDLSPGMLSRPIIVPFKKDLTGEGTQDRNLKTKLLEELPGIFNFALEGWHRLEEQEDFTKSPKTAMSLLEIESASCSATRWIQEQVHFMPGDTGHRYDARGLYAAYKAWHDEAGGKPMGEMKFFKRLAAHHEMKKHRSPDTSKKEYFGLRIGEKKLENEPEIVHF